MTDGTPSPAGDARRKDNASRDWSRLLWMTAALSAWTVFVGMLIIAWNNQQHDSNNDTEAAAVSARIDAEDSGTASPAESRDDQAPGTPVMDAATAAASLSNAEMLQRSGNYRSALKTYEQLQAQATGELAESLEFRIGMCAEALGDNERAMQCYRQITHGGSTAAVRDACRIGQARIWMREGEFSLAAAELSDLRLAPASGPHKGRIAAAAAHLLADAMSRRATAATTGALLSDHDVIAPPVATDLNLLELTRQQAPAMDNPGSSRSGLEVVRQSGTGLNELALSGSLQATPVREIVQRLTALAGLNANWSEAAAQLVLGSSRPVSVDDVDLATLFDLLLTPAGVLWSLDRGGVSVLAASEVPEGERHKFDLAVARRALMVAAIQFPDSELAAGSLFWLGNLAFVEHQWDAAERYYRRVQQDFPRCRAVADAWFNAAKVQLVRGNVKSALHGFLHVVDAARGGESEPAAFLYAGRLMLEAGEARGATPRLLRARVLGRNTEVRQQATLLLSLSYLLDGNPHGANAVLREERREFDPGPTRDVAALVASLSQFKGTNSPPQQQREAPVLLAALSHVSPEDFFGRSGWWIIGDAYRELGLLSRARQTFDDALQQPAPVAFHDRIQFELAVLLEQSGQIDAAQPLLQDLAAQDAGLWPRRARLHLGELSLRSGNLGAALEIARQAMTATDDLDARVDALKLMGRVYQQSGDHAAAAICFAGAIPESGLKGAVQ